MTEPRSLKFLETNKTRFMCLKMLAKHSDPLYASSTDYYIFISNYI